MPDSHWDDATVSGGRRDRTEIEKLAYELYLRRGGEPGHDVEDWLAAEHQLRNGNC
jgi:Protein of unknown function (DUF2934)